MIPVGYDNNSTNYHVLDTTTGKITVTCNVNFNESVRSKKGNEKIDDTFSVIFYILMTKEQSQKTKN